MGNVSRPLIALLVATVAFFALWLVALKPGSGSNTPAPTITQSPGGTSSVSTGGSEGSVGAFKNDINAARNVQNQVNANTASQGAAEAGTPASSAPASSAPASSAPASTATTPAAGSASRHASSTNKAKHAAHHAAAASTSHHGAARHVVANPGVASTPAARLSAVKSAFAQHKVLALLFYNPAGPDDQAVKAELTRIPGDRGQVVKLAIPVGEIPSYAQVMSQIPVNFTPTLVVVSPQRQAFELTGFADSFAIAALIDSAR